MSKMKPLFLTVPGVLALSSSALLGGCLSISPAKYERTLTAQNALAAPAPVKVRTGNGYIRVSRSTSGKVEVSADAALQTPERRDAFAVRSELVGGDWVIEPVWPDGKALSNERCAFTIGLPDAASLDLETSNGRIEFAGFSGPAHAATSNGEIKVASHNGPIDASTSNGAVELKGVAGAAKARTSNGRITIELLAAGPVEARTSNGRIDLTVPAGFTGRLAADTSNGRVTADLAAGARAELRKSSGAVDFGPGPESTLSTSNGAIHITQTAAK